MRSGHYFEVLPCNFNGTIRQKMRFGHNIWLEGPIDLDQRVSTAFCKIFSGTPHSTIFGALKYAHKCAPEYAKYGLWATGLWATGLWATKPLSHKALEPQALEPLWLKGLWLKGRWLKGLWLKGYVARGPVARGLCGSRALWLKGLWLKGLWLEGFVAQGPVAQGPVAERPVAQRPVAQGPVAQVHWVSHFKVNLLWSYFGAFSHLILNVKCWNVRFLTPSLNQIFNLERKKIQEPHLIDERGDQLRVLPFWLAPLLVSRITLQCNLGYKVADIYRVLFLTVPPKFQY